MLYQGYFEAVIRDCGAVSIHKFDYASPPDLILLRGPSGSGKSTVANHLVSMLNNVIVCSTDNFHMVDGEYKFNAEKLGYYHKCNQGHTNSYLAAGHTVIVDNTNLTIQEIIPYLHSAHNQNKTYAIVEPIGPGCMVAEVLAARNKHGVPLEAIQRMLARKHTKEEIEFALKVIRDWEKV